MNFIERLNIALKVLFPKKNQKEYLIPYEEELNARIREGLFRVLKSNSVFGETEIQKMVESVSSSLSGFKGKLAYERFLEIESHFFGNHFWYFTILSGIASLWEFKVKLLAARLGVRIFKNKDEKSAKERKFKIVVYRDFSDIIKDLNRKTKSKIKLDWDQLLDARNSIVHGNLQSLRVLFNIKSRSVPDKHKSSLFVLNLKSNDGPYKTSEVSNPEKMDEIDLMEWFVDGTGSNLLNEVIIEFEKAVMCMNHLINLNSILYGDAEYLREKIFFNSKKIDSDDHGKIIEKLVEAMRLQGDDQIYFLKKSKEYMKNTF